LPLRVHAATRGYDGGDITQEISRRRNCRVRAVILERARLGPFCSPGSLLSANGVALIVRARDIPNHGLSTFVHMDMLNSDELRAAVSQAP
jgi:hypothetical protein